MPEKNRLMGTTSACAENTHCGGNVGYISGNYLRVRGEYASSSLSSRAMMELPPRARRIPDAAKKAAEKAGTTSACAENTLTGDNHASEAWNYLRVRGEYNRIFPGWYEQMELPPRARRIPSLSEDQRKRSGTTSACAENTENKSKSHSLRSNYLRVRGEYVGVWVGLVVGLELPPRARRIQNAGHVGAVRYGTTSACAENTFGMWLVAYYSGNYLRVRGEYRRLGAM